MARSMNRVTLIGHVGRDPETRALNNGNRVVNFSMATSESWRDKQSGERKEATEWHRIVVWNDTAVEFSDKYLRKGDFVLVEGKLKTRKWTDQQGVEKYSTEIHVEFNGQVTSLEKAESSGNGNRREASGGAGYDDQAGYQGGGDGQQRATGNLRDRAGDYRDRDASGRSGIGSDLDDEIPF